MLGYLFTQLAPYRVSVAWWNPLRSQLLSHSPSHTILSPALLLPLRPRMSNKPPNVSFPTGTTLVSLHLAHPFVISPFVNYSPKTSLEFIHYFLLRS